MQFRRSGQRDERRRKVLLDDTAGEKDKARAPGAANTATKTDAVAKAYASAAVEETETRIADLIPTRPLGIFVLFLLALTAVAGVQALYTYLPECQSVLGAEAAAAFDVTARGNLQSWLSSLLLGVAAVAAVMIYAIRRHKMDDYRGRYRLWLWCAAGLTVASINAVAGLHAALDAAMVHFTGIQLWTPGIGWAWAALAAFGGLLALRALLDMWRSRGATLALLLAASCYGGAITLIVLAPRLPIPAAVAQSLAVSLGHVMLLLSLGVYARRVLLEARGLVVVKKKAKKKLAGNKAAAKDKPGDKSSRKIKIDPPHNTAAKTKRTDVDPQPANASSSASATSNVASDEHGPAEGSHEWDELSRSERKRLKKLRRRSAVA